ncbi:hypothetical protein PanWU01x14_368890, partial [Parasponia andersonii]
RLFERKDLYCCRHDNHHCCHLISPLLLLFVRLSPDVDKLVPDHIELATFKAPPRDEYCGNKKIQRTLSLRRRVFVQTETGSVLDIELDRNNNAHMVKRKLQVAFNIPMWYFVEA